MSKWIHLNGGDEGLMIFFNRIHDVLSPGGTFVFEPQEWDGYHKAKRMDQVSRHSQKAFPSLNKCLSVDAKREWQQASIEAGELRGHFDKDRI